MPNNENQWTYDDYRYLYENFYKEDAAGCANKLRKPIATVRSKAERLGLISHTEYTQEEIKLARAYGKILKGAMIFMLPHRTSSEIEELIVCSKRPKQPLPRD